MANEDISSLIAGLQIEDPKLYQALMLINRRLLAAEADLFPLVRQAGEIAEVDAALASPASFTFVFTSLTVRFNWSSVLGASTYEIRKGTVWETASFQLRTPSLQADIDPLLVGSHTFLIKTISNSGVYSTTTAQCIVDVSAIGLVSVIKQVIDNNILLSWVAPASIFAIRHYEVYRNAALIGTLLSTFFVRFEAVAGTYDYKIVAVDIAGNVSPDSVVSVTVSAPPDYVLQDQRTLDFSGTRVNTLRELPASLLACVPIESFQNHFTTRAWLSPQDQLDDGFPLYIQPTEDTGSYVEEIDYGVILSNIIITYTFQLEILVDGVTIIISTRVSDDGTVWSTPQLGASLFVESMRYLELTLTFAATT